MPNLDSIYVLRAELRSLIDIKNRCDDAERLGLCQEWMHEYYLQKRKELVSKYRHLLALILESEVLKG